MMFAHDEIFDEQKEQERLHLWLKSSGLAKYFETLVENEFDCLRSVAHISAADLMDMGITKIGARRKFLICTKELRESLAQSNVMNHWDPVIKPQATFGTPTKIGQLDLSSTIPAVSSHFSSATKPTFDEVKKPATDLPNLATPTEKKNGHRLDPIPGRPITSMALLDTDELSLESDSLPSRPRGPRPSSATRGGSARKRPSSANKATHGQRFPPLLSMSEGDFSPKSLTWDREEVEAELVKALEELQIPVHGPQKKTPKVKGPSSRPSSANQRSSRPSSANRPISRPSSANRPASRPSSANWPSSRPSSASFHTVPSDDRQVSPSQSGSPKYGGYDRAALELAYQEAKRAMENKEDVGFLLAPMLLHQEDMWSREKFIMEMEQENEDLENIVDTAESVLQQDMQEQLAAIQATKEAMKKRMALTMTGVIKASTKLKRLKSQAEKKREESGLVLVPRPAKRKQKLNMAKGEWERTLDEQQLKLEIAAKKNTAYRNGFNFWLLMPHTNDFSMLPDDVPKPRDQTEIKLRRKLKGLIGMMGAGVDARKKLEQLEGMESNCEGLQDDELPQLPAASSVEAGTTGSAPTEITCPPR
uniref:SAM domain-containing protein n=1 Tax=Eutreptiella gymnastica TaxID=73025 RepID=A0A6U7XIV7_9EUGL|mmetsp:Transcript_140652/g.244932  ORF Transcript_140652/g.244932 Transcript_140652/m.244932 type:complete len:592 (+) Transcript_140652:104-1879(+)